jgi:hypothetical protein
MESILILVVSCAVLMIAGHSAKTVFWDMRKQGSLNADFLKRRSFAEAPEQRERMKEIIVARDPRIGLAKAVSPSPGMVKIVDCHQSTASGKEIFFMRVTGFAQPKSMVEGVYLLAPLRKHKRDPFYVSLWSNTYGPGSWMVRSQKRYSLFDFGKIGRMNGREIVRSADLPGFEHVDFYGPREEHPEHYLGSGLLEMVRNCRPNGIAEISCLDGLALFRIYSLTGAQKPGNVLTDPETPYRYILDYL